MTTQKKYQRLQWTNLKAAEIIYNALKKEKALSAKRFGDLFCQRPGGTSRHGSFNKLMKTTHTFLLDHDLMTIEYINGLIIYVATQKCFRTKNFENATIEYQYVTNGALDTAIEYQELNNGLIDPYMEGTVIAKNILGLTGKLIKDYANEYKYMYEFHNELITNNDRSPFYGSNPQMKYAVLAPIRSLGGIIKKI